MVSLCFLFDWFVYENTPTSTEGEIFQSHHRLLICTLRELPFDSLSRIPDGINLLRHLPHATSLVSSDLLVCLIVIFRYLHALMC